VIIPDFFNKSQVLSFSSFEKRRRQPLKLSNGPRVFRQKPGMQFFFFRKTSSSTSGLRGFASLTIAFSKSLIQALAILGWSEPVQGSYEG